MIGKRRKTVVPPELLITKYLLSWNTDEDGKSVSSNMKDPETWPQFSARCIIISFPWSSDFPKHLCDRLAPLLSFVSLLAIIFLEYHQQSEHQILGSGSICLDINCVVYSIICFHPTTGSTDTYSKKLVLFRKNNSSMR